VAPSSVLLSLAKSLASEPDRQFRRAQRKQHEQLQPTSCLSASIVVVTVQKSAFSDDFSLAMADSVQISSDTDDSGEIY
jgi:hypothetical protein